MRAPLVMQILAGWRVHPIDRAHLLWADTKDAGAVILGQRFYQLISTTCGDLVPLTRNGEKLTTERTEVRQRP